MGGGFDGERDHLKT